MLTLVGFAVDIDQVTEMHTRADQFGFRVKFTRLVEMTNEIHENLAEHHYVVTLHNVTNNMVASTADRAFQSCTRN